MTDVYRGRFANDRNWAILEKLDGFASDRGHSTTDLAFAWLLAHPVIRTVTAGATRPEQVEANARACDWRMSAEDVASVRALL